MPTYDIVIKGGTIIDGLQTPRYKADVGDQGRQDRRRSAATSTPSDGDRGRRRRPGKIVAPGRRRRAHALRQPAVLGPVVHDVGLARGHHRADRQLRLRVRALQAGGPGPGDAVSLSRNEAVPLKTMRAGMPWDWETFPEFLDSVDRTPKGVNVMSLVPLAPLYQYVVGVDKAKEFRATDEELEQMCRLARRGDGGRRLRLELADLRRHRTTSSATTTARRWSPTR